MARDAQVERLLNCRTEAARRVAIRRLLLSPEPLTKEARQLIAGYFRHGGERKGSAESDLAGYLFFAMHCGHELHGSPRNELIVRACELTGCSRRGLRSLIRDHRLAWPTDPYEMHDAIQRAIELLDRKASGHRR